MLDLTLVRRYPDLPAGPRAAIVRHDVIDALDAAASDARACTLPGGGRLLLVDAAAGTGATTAAVQYARARMGIYVGAADAVDAARLSRDPAPLPVSATAGGCVVIDRPEHFTGLGAWLAATGALVVLVRVGQSPQAAARWPLASMCTGGSPDAVLVELWRNCGLARAERIALEPWASLRSRMTAPDEIPLAAAGGAVAHAVDLAELAARRPGWLDMRLEPVAPRPAGLIERLVGALAGRSLAPAATRAQPAVALVAREVDLEAAACRYVSRLRGSRSLLGDITVEPDALRQHGLVSQRTWASLPRGTRVRVERHGGQFAAQVLVGEGPTPLQDRLRFQ